MNRHCHPNSRTGSAAAMVDQALLAHPTAGQVAVQLVTTSRSAPGHLATGQTTVTQCPAWRRQSAAVFAWAGLLASLLLLWPACSDHGQHAADAAMDRAVLPDRLQDRAVAVDASDAGMDSSTLPDARPDYLMPDTGCTPQTQPPEEIQPGLLYRLPPTGENNIDSFDVSERYVVYSEVRCPPDTDEHYDSFVFDLRTMTESLGPSGFGNQYDGYIWQDTFAYMDDSLTWPPFSDDPANKHQLNLYLYDITTGASTLLLDGSWGKIPLDFNGTQVLYMSNEYDPDTQDDRPDTKLYDIDTGEDRLLVEHGVTVLSRALSANYAAWVTRSGDAWDVFYHDIQANQTIALNRLSNYHFQVEVSQRYLYWDEGTQFGDYDIWSHDLTTGQDEVITDPGSDQGFARAGVGSAGHLVLFVDYSRSGARYPNYPIDVVLLDRDTGIQRTLTTQPDHIGLLRPTCEWAFFSRGDPSNRFRARFYMWNLVEAGVLDDSCHVLPCDQQTEDCTTVQIPPWQ